MVVNVSPLQAVEWCNDVIPVQAAMSNIAVCYHPFSDGHVEVEVCVGGGGAFGCCPLSLLQEKICGWTSSAFADLHASLATGVCMVHGA